MNFTKTDMEGNSWRIREKDELSNKIQDNMFTFENFDGLDNRSVQTLMRSIDNDLLMTAVKGATEPVKKKNSLSNMSTREPD